MALRTVHSSYVDLDPTEYEYVGSFDAYPRDGEFHSHDDKRPFDAYGVTVNAFNWVHAEYLALRHLLTTSTTSAWNDANEVDTWPGGRCDHCGAHLRYVVVWLHTPTGSHMATGETCADERFGHASKVAKDVDRLRKRAAAERANARVRAAVDAWLADDAANLEAVEYAEATREANYFHADLLRKLKQYGPWSVRQRDAVLRNKVKDAVKAAEREAEAALPVAPVPEVDGRLTVTGTVVSCYFKDDDYGGRTVMVVRDDRGFKVWGTRPGSLWTVEVGDRVRFDAAVTRSDRDESFGFFKRPTKASVLPPVDETVAA